MKIPERFLDRSREVLVQVLVLYRKRSGEGIFGDEGVLSAGAFSIQRLEGSGFGIVQLWVLNADEFGESWEARDWRRRMRETSSS